MTEAQRDEPLDRYRRARDAAVAALGELEALLAGTPLWHDAANDRAEIARTVLRLRDGRFVLAVVGEFSSGKSFLLNALLGKVEHEERMGVKRIVGLLATDINPSTATITELTYAPEQSATAFYANGREERVPLGRLSRFVAVGEAAVHDATGDDNGAPTLVRVNVDSAFLANGFVVADTPGLASINPAHRRATLSYLPGADAVMYLVDTQQPFSDGDASFLGIIRRYIESIFIVQTKIDLWRMRDGDRETWQTASARIVAQAALHAPDVPVFALSARDYAEGQLEANADLIAQSRFPEFLAALDASLVATTGRARLRRAAAQARRLATRAGDTLAREIAALEMDPAALLAARENLGPALDAVDAAAATGNASCVELGRVLESAIVEGGVQLCASLQRTLGRAFDIADIARLRDRAKLHIIIDDTLAAAVGRFAADVADLVAGRLRVEARTAIRALIGEARGADSAGALQTVLAAIGAERLPLTEDAALAFGADPASGAWSTNLESGLRSTIVLGALGGPAVVLVTAIAERFAAAPYGTYMKRELVADLDATLLPLFEAEITTYVALNAARVRTIAQRLAERIGALAPRVRFEAVAALDAALAARAHSPDVSERIVAARRRNDQFGALATRVDTLSETFARESRTEHGERSEAVSSALARAPNNPAVSVSVRFDPESYEHGLRPERWRVAVLGALRRGKSSLINAIAGERILRDEGGEIEMRFPVHVRYGPHARAYALGDDAGWDPVPLDSALDAATRTPVLIEIPWRWPRQLVLVHSPPFDSGLPDAERVVFAVAAGASEVLALFSRQLSDRELDVYGRIAALGKPLSFVHTMADNEEPAERRNVLLLADRYLRERAIVAQRLFTISTHDYRTALENGHQPAAWNEFDALTSTLEARAQEHMARLARVERDRIAAQQLAGSAARSASLAAKPPPSFIRKLFGLR